jgi:enoyl-CoA hydratase
MSDYSNILYETQDGIAVVTINRPKVLNALDTDTMNELDAAVRAAGKDSAVRGVVITGAGEKAFVAGADINILSKLSPVEGKEYSLWGQGVLNRIERLGKPIVAAINGYALGGGLELALACHVRFASENAVLGLPEVSLGIIPGYGGTQRLARVVGKGRAMELVLSAGKIKADEALRIGLVNRVVPQNELLPAAKGWISECAKNGPVAVKLAIDALNDGLEMTQQEGLFLEASLFGLCAATDDMREGMAAFLEKRKAGFKGR